MSTYKFLKCDICDTRSDDIPIHEGWAGWGALQGVHNQDTGESEIALCPDCLMNVSSYLKNIKGE